VQRVLSDSYVPTGDGCEGVAPGPVHPQGVALRRGLPQSRPNWSHSFPTEAVGRCGSEGGQGWGTEGDRGQHLLRTFPGICSASAPGQVIAVLPYPRFRPFPFYKDVLASRDCCHLSHQEGLASPSGILSPSGRAPLNETIQVVYILSA
jgi:hypothetical protein